MSKNISQLRTFFRLSNAAFDFVNAVQTSFNQKVVPSKMQQLNRLALNEIEKESPNLSIIKQLLSEMESLSEFNSDSKHENQ